MSVTPSQQESLNQNSTPTNSNPISNIQDDNPIIFGLKWIESTTKDPQQFRRTFLYLALVLGFLLSFWGITLARSGSVNLFNKLTVETGKAGTLKLEDNQKTSFIMMLSPNGGIDDEWIDPQIKVKKGQKITINASGKINLSLSRMVKATQEDVGLSIPWNDPSGLSPKYIDPLYPDVKQYKTMPEQPFGMLIAAIQEEEGKRELSLYPIGKNGEFTAEANGKLLLTINDVWLSPDKPDTYLPPDPTGKNREYYQDKVLRSINGDRTKAEQETSAWTKEKWEKKLVEQYEERKKKWEMITSQRNYGLWYDDNIGSFSVTLSIEPEGKNTK